VRFGIEVRAAGVALQGVQKEAQAAAHHGDVVNSQQTDFGEGTVIGAQRDHVIRLHLLSAIGKLDVKTLRLQHPDYLLKCITIRCATPGTACARRRGGRFSNPRMKAAAFTSWTVSQHQAWLLYALPCSASRWDAAVAQSSRKFVLRSTADICRRTHDPSRLALAAIFSHRDRGNARRDIGEKRHRHC